MTHSFDGEYTVVSLVRRIAEDKHKAAYMRMTGPFTCSYCGATSEHEERLHDPGNHDGDCLYRVATALIARLDAGRAVPETVDE